MDIEFHVNMSRMYATPRDLAFTFTLSSTSPDIYTAIFLGSLNIEIWDSNDYKISDLAIHFGLSGAI